MRRKDRNLSLCLVDRNIQCKNQISKTTNKENNSNQMTTAPKIEGSLQRETLKVVVKAVKGMKQGKERKAVLVKLMCK